MRIHNEDLGGHVALVRIENEARRNAMTRAMMAELAELWDGLEAGPCRAIVLTGTGERAFCSGADLSGDLSASPETAATVSRALLKTRRFRKPIVAAVNGDCVAGGIELLISTDIRGAAGTARFGLPEVRWGIYPFGGAATKLVRQIGYVHVMDMILTGRLLDAGEAKGIGLVNEVLPGSELLDWAVDRARTVAANSPAAVQAVKEQITAGLEEWMVSQEPREQVLGDRVRASPDFREGVAAFLGKRAPHYGGAGDGRDTR